MAVCIISLFEIYTKANCFIIPYIVKISWSKKTKIPLFSYKIKPGGLYFSLVTGHVYEFNGIDNPLNPPFLRGT